MIWNQWYPIIESKELKKKNKLLGVTRLGEKLVLWRKKNDEIVCLFDKCAHRGAALSAGKIIEDHVQCPFHGLEFNKSGKCTYIPSRGRNAQVPENFKVHSYPTREAHGFIWIWWGEKREEYPKLPWFDDLGDEFIYSTHTCDWKTHYSRCIENQLDVAHLWIVHASTIGKGNARVCDGPITKFDNGIEKVWVYNRKEDGKVSKLPKEMEEPQEKPFLHLTFPNIWQNKIAEDLRVFVAFVPVDEENSVLYMRFYQRFMKVPLLGKFIAWVGQIFSIIILHQDRRVVHTQVPKKTGLKIGENLFPADGPIVMYRKLRDELQRINPKPE